jgi:hypothetical protein
MTTKQKTPTLSLKPAMSLPPDDEWPAQLRHFRDFCLKLPIEDGTPLALYPEQVRMLWAYFNGTRETLILIPKKNGKSSLLAALALFHLATVPDASVYIGASSRDQATILFDQAAAMIRRSEYAAKLFDVKGGYREARCKSMVSFRPWPSSTSCTVTALPISPVSSAMGSEPARGRC